MCFLIQFDKQNVVIEMNLKNKFKIHDLKIDDKINMLHIYNNDNIR